MERHLHQGEFEVKEIDAENRTITGMITTDAVDRYREVVDPNGAVLEAYRKNPVVLLNHASWGLPIGKNLWIKSASNGLIAKTQFADTQLGRDVLGLYEGKYMRAWSIGFIPQAWEDYDVVEFGYRRKYTQWELLEYSAVTVPANPEAVTNALDRVGDPQLRSLIELEGMRQQADALASAQQRVNERLTVLGSTVSERLDALEELLAQIEQKMTGAPAETPGKTPTKTPTKRAIKPTFDTATLGLPAADLTDEVRRIVAEVIGRRPGAK